MDNKKRDIHQMVNDLISQITGENKKETPRTDSLRKNLDKLGDWTTKKSIPLNSTMTQEEQNKLVMRANIELKAFVKRYNTMRSFLMAETQFADKFSAELDAMSEAIREMDMIINLNDVEDIQNDPEFYPVFLEKREEFLRRFE